MQDFASTLRLPWRCAVLVLGAVMAGCGVGSGGGATDSGTEAVTAAGAGTGFGGAGRGPAPIDLKTAVDFVMLARTGIAGGAPSTVTGDLGLYPASGANVALSCAEVTGTIYSVDKAGPLPCRVTDATRLKFAEADAINAFENDGRLRTADYTDLGGGNIGGRNLGPATYKWTTGVQIPTDLTLTGGPNDVWIFLATQNLRVGAGVSIILVGGALPGNVYWLTLIDDAEFGENSRFQGIVMAETSIVMRTGASIDGRLMAATSISLDQNRVTQPPL